MQPRLLSWGGIVIAECDLPCAKRVVLFLWEVRLQILLMQPG